MKYAFVRKLLILSALLIGQGIIAMAQQPAFDLEQQNALMERINVLTLDQNGALSDQVLVADIGSLLGRTDSALLRAAGAPNTPYLTVKRILADEEEYNENQIREGVSSKDPHQQVAMALLIAALEKIAELKKAREQRRQ